MAGQSTNRKVASDAASPFASKRGRPTASQAEAISRSISRAATDLFLAEGFDAVSMDAVAAAAGVPKSTLYKRYLNKRALLRAVLDARVEEWSAASAQQNQSLPHHLEQRLKCYCIQMISWARTPDVRAFTKLSASAWDGTEEAGSHRDAVGFTKMMQLIEHDIQQLGPRTGIVAKDPHRVAATLMAMVAGWFHLVGPDDESDMAAFVDGAVEIIMSGSAAW